MLGMLEAVFYLIMTLVVATALGIKVGQWIFAAFSSAEKAKKGEVTEKQTAKEQLERLMGEDRVLSPPKIETNPTEAQIVEEPAHVQDVVLEIGKYATAVAHFKRYDKGHSFRDMWEDGHNKGFEYWESKGIAATDTEDLSKVSAEAKCAFTEATADGRTAANLALALGRAMTRFKLVASFKGHVVPTVTAALEKLEEDNTPWSDAHAEVVTATAYLAASSVFAEMVDTIQVKPLPTITCVSAPMPAIYVRS